MTRLCEEYIRCRSIEDALQALSAYPGSAHILAGGSDLLLELQQARHPPAQVLVDVSEIEEMCLLEARGESIFVGAAVTLSRLAKSSLIAQHATALADAAGLMANPLVCNVATIGGNIAHALPAADGTIALLALDAQAEVADLNGRHLLPLEALFKGPGVTTLDSHRQVLVGFYLPPQKPGEASAFVRRVNPQGVALALLNVAVWLKSQGERLVDIRIAVGPSGPVPGRMRAAEEVLRGQSPSVEILQQAVEALLSEASFRTSPHRATTEYRQHLAGVLFNEAFNKAWHRAGQAA